MAKARTKPKAEAAEPVKVLSYKGFDKDFKCRDFQFEVGKTYTIGGKIEACKRGFHACENPFDVWNYYGIGEGNRFAVVEQSGDISRHDGDSKVASGSITIKAEISLPEFIKNAVSRIIEMTKNAVGNDSGNDAKIGSSGNDAKIGSSGNDAKIGSSGYNAQIGSSGNNAKIGSSGYNAKIGSSGDNAKIGSSGNDAKIGSSGYDAKIEAEGNDAVIAAAGHSTRVKAKPGTWVSLAEFDPVGKCVGFATGQVGTNGIAADVWLVAKSGKLVAEK